MMLVPLLQVWKTPTGAPGASHADLIGAADMRVGAVLPIFARGFELLEADEHTLAFMEARPELYPHADLDRVRKSGGLQE